MSWTIFITSIDNPVFTFDIIYKLYTLRWRIECIFKTWKSHFSFTAVHNVSEIQLRVLLIARLIMICTAFHKLYIPINNFLFKNRNKAISMLKFMKLVARHFEKILVLATSASKLEYDAMLEIIAKNCAYDKRKRTNYNQEFLETIEVLSSLKLLT